jgi:hypothetical protein
MLATAAAKENAYAEFFCHSVFLVPVQNA